MFLADLLDLKEHKESKTGFKWKDKSRFHGVSHKTAFPHCWFRRSTWSVDTKPCDLRAKKRMDYKNEIYSDQQFGNWCFRFILSTSILGFTVLLSYILRYWLSSFKLSLIFFQSQLWQHISIVKSHFKIVEQTLREKKDREKVLGKKN